jgi:hydrogenase 3 maturation protease
MEYLLLCIGNRDGGDDAIGPYIANNIKSNNQILAIDCGTNPENYTSIVKKHNIKKLVIIDATDMGLSPGELRIIPIEKISRMHISTHGIPLSVLIDYLKLYVPKILLIGIQPKKLNGKISDVVKRSGNHLIKMIEHNELLKIKEL